MPAPREVKSRRRASPSKGDQRELAILDAAERQIIDVGLDRMTVETIATAAGITRGALYFYFSSKNDVLAALVERIASSIVSEVEQADASAPSDPREALRHGVLQTARLWHDHGAVMRAAVELSPSVPAIDEHWRAAIAATASTTRRAMVRAGTPDDDGPRGAAALSRALVWTTERSFYEAVKGGVSLDEVAETVIHLWSAALPD
jgi:TetR/AcrR family transcriptional regulator, ethionamide resistance regulator